MQQQAISKEVPDTVVNFIVDDTDNNVEQCIRAKAIFSDMADIVGCPPGACWRATLIKFADRGSQNYNCDERVLCSGIRNCMKRVY